jgi:TetR/AcrR family transcriptional regulator, tetracycline repressor protein
MTTVRIHRGQVIQDALDILDEEGLDGLTMRVLAKKLKIKAPSLYWHFANKQELVDALADALMEPVARELDLQADWQRVFTNLAHEIRHALLARRDGGRVFAGTYPPLGNILRVGEALMSCLRRAGGSPKFAAWGAFSASYFITGFVMEEQAFDQTKSYSTIDLAARRKAILSFSSESHSQAYREALPALFDKDFDSRFEFGFSIILRGIVSKLKEDPSGDKAAASKLRRSGKGRKTIEEAQHRRGN